MLRGGRQGGLRLHTVAHMGRGDGDGDTDGGCSLVFRVLAGVSGVAGLGAVAVAQAGPPRPCNGTCAAARHCSPCFLCPIVLLSLPSGRAQWRRRECPLPS